MTNQDGRGDGDRQGRDVLLPRGRRPRRWSANDPRLTFGRFLAEVARRASARGARSSSRAARSAYRELEREARLLARALIGAGVVKGARVAVHMANRPEWIVAAFAVRHAGRRARAREHLREPERARLRAATQRRVGAADAARAAEAPLPRGPARRVPRDRARRARAVCAASICRSCAGSPASGSTRRAAASRPGGSCSPTSRASATSCSTRRSPRSSPPTTAC